MLMCKYPKKNRSCCLIDILYLSCIEYLTLGKYIIQLFNEFHVLQRDIIKIFEGAAKAIDERISQNFGCFGYAFSTHPLIKSIDTIL